MTSIGHYTAQARVNILNQTLKLGFSKKTNGRIKLFNAEATDPRLIFSKTLNKCRGCQSREILDSLTIKNRAFCQWCGDWKVLIADRRHIFQLSCKWHDICEFVTSQQSNILCTWLCPPLSVSLEDDFGIVEMIVNPRIHSSNDFTPLFYNSVMLCLAVSSLCV